jgi:glycosyltransferase involved in cell wall biosynthesis
MPAAHRGDAIGDAALRYRARLRAMGHESEIYAIEIDAAAAGDVLPFGSRASRAGDLTILHFATPSPMTEAFADLRGARVLHYHNITPPEFFAPFDPHLVQLCLQARAELASLVGQADVALGVSEYNRRELEVMGFRDTGVLPLDVDVDRLRRAPRVPALEHWLGDGMTNILFVGRIAPNKKIEDIIRLAACYRRCVDARVRLIFVGRYDAVPGYYEMLRALLATLGWPSDRVLFTGPVPDDDLAAYYRSSSVYLSMSEHEGFCVPLIEAMAADLPVLAYSCTAIPETLGGAGVAFAPKDFEHAAELLGLLAFDEGVRRQVIDGQRRRLAHFSGARVEDGLGALSGRFQ